MDRLPSSTLRRLKQLPQTPNSVWEGDRIQLNAKVRDPDSPRGSNPADCILWVDGVEQTVRTIEPIPASDGPEAYVRALIKAMEAPMEMPQMPMGKVRPQKVVVRTREVQFFLRGILKDLDIQVEYHGDLPLIDEMAPGLRQLIGTAEDNLTDELYDLLEEKAQQIWKTAPWQELQDAQILEVKVSLFDLDPFYLSVMGNLGMEYGLLLYRSIDSLKSFREAALSHGEDMRQMQLAFMSQDCLFVNFEQAGMDSEGPISLMQLLQDSADGADEGGEIEIEWGSINPIEGIRADLHEEEAIALIVALESIHRFFRKNRRQFQDGKFPSCTGRFRIALPSEIMPEVITQKTVSVQISSQLKLTQELWDMTDKLTADQEGGPALPAEFENLPEELQGLLQGLQQGLRPAPALVDELIPEGAITLIGQMEWDLYERLVAAKGIRLQASKKRLSRKGKGFPVFIIQTSKAKAKTIIKQIEKAGGVAGLGFCMVQDMDEMTALEVSVIRLDNGELNVVNDYEPEDPTHLKTKQRWDRNIKTTKGTCGFVVATSLRGQPKGYVSFEGIVALYETEALEIQNLL